MLTASHRIQRVDAPIIPTVAALVRDNPGTISLGQGVVNYGPPPQALQAIGPMADIGSNHKYQAVEGLATLHQALREQPDRATIENRCNTLIDEMTTLVDDLRHALPDTA